MTTHSAAVPSAAVAVDPRSAFFGALALGGEVVAAVRPEQLADPTPCPEFDVRALLGHLVAVVRRTAAVGRGADPFSVPQVAEVADGDWAAAWADAVSDLSAVWSDDALLARPVRLPFATLPGAVALRTYTSEVSVHTWDLATATGQSPRWDDEVLAVAYAQIQRALPAEPRGGSVPFAPVVPVPADAPLIDRLVAWTGRRPSAAG